MKRRDFLNKSLIGTISSLGILSLAGALRTAFPNISGSSKALRIGRKDDYPMHAFTFLPDKNIFVYRDRIGLKSVSALCTHLGCTVNRVTTGFLCPCHGSQYDEDGIVVGGPAPRTLAWHSIKLLPGDEIEVDTGAVLENNSYFNIKPGA